MGRDIVGDFGRDIMQADGLARADIGRRGRPIGTHLEDRRQAALESVYRDPAGVPATAFIIGQETLGFARAPGCFR